MKPPPSVAVIGAGPMGLLCAYRLLQKGYKVSLFEGDRRIGGMSASFDFSGLQIERFYHFICRGDQTLLSVLAEFDLLPKLKWRKTRMGFYYEGTLYKWNDPLQLLLFPKLGLLSKLRYAGLIYYAQHASNWRALDRKNANTWLKSWLGEKGYALLWQKLLHYKYYELNKDISAAWIAARIRRVARSRKNMFTEVLGYLEGGSETLLAVLAGRITSLGGEIRLRQRVTRVNVRDGNVKSITLNDREEAFDYVISTIPIPYVPDLVPGLAPDILLRIKNIKNIGVICVILKLEQSISDKFWVNINDARIAIPGIIEYSNLYPLPDPVVYVPYYMPQTHPNYHHSDAGFIAETYRYLSMINPQFSENWVKSVHVSRYAFAQPVCTTGFFQSLPPMETNIEGFLMADTTYYYPEDRSISESFRLGEILAGRLPVPEA